MRRALIERIAAPGRVRLAAIGVGVALLAGSLIGYLSHGAFAGRYAVPVAGREDPSATRAAIAPVPVPPPEPSRPVAAPPPPEAAAAPLREEEEDDGARIAAAIDRATRKALDRGETVRWHKAGVDGYVVVSAEQVYPNRVCRNVSATIGDEDDQTRSNTHLWCLSADADDWAPA